jgi:hypothetical protein
MKAIKEELDELGKKINDEKLDVVAIDETIQIPAKDSGYQINNGHKITGERASVTVQFKKDSDLKSQGMTGCKNPEYLSAKDIAWRRGHNTLGL